MTAHGYLTSRLAPSGLPDKKCGQTGRQTQHHAIMHVSPAPDRGVNSNSSVTRPEQQCWTTKTPELGNDARSWCIRFLRNNNLIETLERLLHFLGGVPRRGCESRPRRPTSSVYQTKLTESHEPSNKRPEHNTQPAESIFPRFYAASFPMTATRASPYSGVMPVQSWNYPLR